MTPAGTALRIHGPSPLWIRWQWLRLSLPFRWAHRPLCDRFAGDILRLGGIAVCRSCVCAYAGALLALAGWFSGVLGAGEWTAAGPLTALVVLGGSAAPFYKKLPRAVRDGLRFLTGALAAATLLLAAEGRPLGFGALAVFTVAYAVIRRQRMARRTTACDGCPELGRGGVCSGFAPQAQASRRLDALLQPLMWGERRLG